MRSATGPAENRELPDPESFRDGLNVGDDIDYPP
jgi:hypothetical protein